GAPEFRCPCRRRAGARPGPAGGHRELRAARPRHGDAPPAAGVQGRRAAARQRAAARLNPVSIFPVPGIPEIVNGASLATLILEGVERLGMSLEPGDVVVVTQKVVSKAEGRVRALDGVVPSPRAIEIGNRIGFDPRHVEVILSESVRIVREAPHVLITETRHGFVCANAGVDRSNTGGRELVVLLPERPDESARRLRDSLKELSGVAPGVVDRKSTRLNSSHVSISYAVFCLKKKNII